MSEELWCQTSAGLYVPVGMYGLLPVNRPGHNSIKVPQKQHFYLYQGGREAIFHSEEQIEQHFYTPWGKQMKPAVIITVSLSGYVSAVPEAVCTFVSASLWGHEACLCKPLTHRCHFYHSCLWVEKPSHHNWPPVAKINRFFWTWLPVIFLEKNLFLFLFIVINYSKQHCSSHAGKSTCAFPSEYPFICSLFHASISQITCICSIIYLFN